MGSRAARQLRMGLGADLSAPPAPQGGAPVSALGKLLWARPVVSEGMKGGGGAGTTGKRKKKTPKDMGRGERERGTREGARERGNTGVGCSCFSVS